MDKLACPRPLMATPSLHQANTHKQTRTILAQLLPTEPPQQPLPQCDRQLHDLTCSPASPLHGCISQCDHAAGAPPSSNPPRIAPPGQGFVLRTGT